MSATQVRMARPEAVRIARAFVDRIDDCCETLVVAGSLRRRLAWVGDVEIVAVPKLEPVTLDLLGEEIQYLDRLDGRLFALLEDGVVEQRLDRHGAPRWGPALKYLTFQDVPIDLFSPSAERAGWILLLRTGPAAFSRQLVVERGRRTKDGRPGLLPSTVLPRDGWLTWRVSGERIPTLTERDAFDALGLPHTDPWERT